MDMMLFALVLVLAQTATPPPPMVTTPSATSTTAASDPGVRRAPVAFTPSKDAALITNTGSTNFGGFEIAVEPDGAALVREPSGVRRGTVSRATAKWFFAHLAADRPLGRMAILHCMKPVSFGSDTLVAWQGQTTPDLSCGGGPATQELNRTIRAIERQLVVVPQKKGLRYPM
jgi:hypothetical protein